MLHPVCSFDPSWAGKRGWGPLGMDLTPYRPFCHLGLKVPTQTCPQPVQMGTRHSISLLLEMRCCEKGDTHTPVPAHPSLACPHLPHPCERPQSPSCRVTGLTATVPCIHPTLGNTYNDWCPSSLNPTVWDPGHPRLQLTPWVSALAPRPCGCWPWR